jgi:hypothetical protein
MAKAHVLLIFIRASIMEWSPFEKPTVAQVVNNFSMFYLNSVYTLFSDAVNKRLNSIERMYDSEYEWESNGYRGVKRQKGETDHSPPSSAEVKKDRAISTLPHMSSWRSA